MTGAGAAADERLPYSPHRRTAILFAGTGTAGAYHAGALRAFAEAGVKIDLVGGRGAGAIAAVFAAVDGASRLYEPSGLWHHARARRMYGWRGTYLAAAAVPVCALAVLVPPILLVLVDLLYYLMALTVRIAGVAPAGGLVHLRDGIFAAVTSSGSLPDVIARAALGPLVLLTAYLLASAVWKRSRGGTLLDPPWTIHKFMAGLERQLWVLVRGVARAGRPASRQDLSRAYLALQAENLGQPGFRELLVLVRDLDARTDLACVSLSDDYRRVYARAREAGKAGGRRMISSGSDYLDLRAEENQGALAVALEAALALPMLTPPVRFAFAHESFWRGEVHRLCGPSSGDDRLVAEAVAAGAEQVILVSAAPPDPPGPRGLPPRPRTARGAAGEHVMVADAGAARAAIEHAHGITEPPFSLFVIRPEENPLGAFDFDGCYDARADRPASVEDLTRQGYRDAYRLFIEPVVGASGERIATSGA